MSATVDFPKLYDTPPVVSMRPTAAEIAAANPAGLDGQVTLRCAVTEAGALDACHADAEPRHDPRLDSIALSLVSYFRVKPARLGGKPVASGQALVIATKEHRITNPDWLRKPDGNALAAVLPQRALETGTSGVAKIRCDVADDGNLVDCAVESETPAGFGFGAAALLLAPNFQMKPRLVDGKPQPGGTVTIPLRFELPEEGGFIQSGGALKIMAWAPWRAAPSAEAFRSAFPARAAAQKVYGRVALRCGVSAEGQLKNCEATSETPGGWGFEAAARKLVPAFGLNVEGVAPAQLRQLRVLVAFDFSARALQPTAERVARSIDWVRSFDAKDVLEDYPANAAAAGVFSGRSVLHCVIGAAGTLDDCNVVEQTPPELGFGEAGLKIAKVMRANLWSQEGEPTAGETINLPIRLLYNGEPPSKAAATPKPGG